MKGSKCSARSAYSNFLRVWARRLWARRYAAPVSSSFMGHRGATGGPSIYCSGESHRQPRSIHCQSLQRVHFLHSYFTQNIRYCHLLLIMAANGLLEAWMYSQASSQWLHTCQMFNLATSATCLTLSACLVKPPLWLPIHSSGAIGVVVGSAVAMIARCVLCIYFIISSEAETKHASLGVNQLRRLLLSPEFEKVAVVGIAAGIALRIVLSSLMKRLVWRATLPFPRIFTDSISTLCEAPHSGIGYRGTLYRHAAFDSLVGIFMGLMAVAIVRKDIVRVLRASRK